MDKYSGKRLDGRYEIGDLLGVGGMAYVYKAYDSIDDRVVAIKILKDEFLGNEEFMRRFKNESKAIAVLSHPNIVKVYDVSFGDRIQYIVMEYIDGITRKDYIERQHDIKWKEAVHFTGQILAALQHAHEKGIIHRDVKPQNIMLLQDGTIKVTDFGIARFAKNETRTMTDKAIGSVHYIAPEQARGDLTDAKADIYSVGVMLYEMLTGQLPFEADNAVSVAIMQLQQDPTPPRQINPAIPEGLEEITLKAMQKDPAQRYQSAAEMLRDLGLFNRNPSIRFQYQYYSGESSTKYIDNLDSVRTGPIAKPEYDDGYDYEDVKTAKKTRPTAVYVLGGICAAVVLIAVILGIMAFARSCSSEEIKDVPIPSFVGQKYDDIMAKKEAGEYKFTFIKQDGKDETKEEGIVLAQTPEVSETKMIKENSEITLVVNVLNTEGEVPVPDVKAWKQADAEKELKDAGLVPKITPVADDDTAEGYVKTTDPAPGSKVEKGSTVTLFVSTGPSTEKTAVPNVIYDSEETARQKIEAAGLKVGNIEPRYSNQDAGIVIETDPLPTTMVSEGSTVNLVVSKGPEPAKTLSGTVMISLPAEITWDVDLQLEAYIDGERVLGITVNPMYGKRDYEVPVTGEANSGQKVVTVLINDSLYFTCYVDFGATDITMRQENNPNFEMPQPPEPSSSEPAEPSAPSEPGSGDGGESGDQE